MAGFEGIVPFADEEEQCNVVFPVLEQFVRKPEMLEDASPGSIAVISMHLKRCTKCQKEVFKIRYPVDT